MNHATYSEVVSILAAMVEYANEQTGDYFDFLFDLIEELMQRQAAFRGVTYEQLHTDMSKAWQAAHAA
jgi:hypothetical protein